MLLKETGRRGRCMLWKADQVVASSGCWAPTPAQAVANRRPAPRGSANACETGTCRPDMPVGTILVAPLLWFAKIHCVVRELWPGNCGAQGRESGEKMARKKKPFVPQGRRHHCAWDLWSIDCGLRGLEEARGVKWAWRGRTRKGDSFVSSFLKAQRDQSLRAR